MTESFLQFESSNIQNILIALVVICAIVYGFIEYRKINTKINELSDIVNRLQQPMNMMGHADGSILSDDIERPASDNKELHANESLLQRMKDSIPQSMKDFITPKGSTGSKESTGSIITKPETSIVDTNKSLVNNIINQVDENMVPNKTSLMGCLFISVASSSIDINGVKDINDVESNNQIDDKERIVELHGPDEEPNIVEPNIVEPNIVEPNIVEPNIVEPNIVELNITEPIVDDVTDPILEHIDDTNYEEYTIKDLKTTLEDMGLSTSGNKSKLIERILSNKNKI